MSAPLKVPLEFDQLPVEQRLAYVQALWDRIAAHPENVPVPLEHQQVLLERIATYTRSFLRLLFVEDAAAADAASASSYAYVFKIFVAS